MRPSGRTGQPTKPAAHDLAHGVDHRSLAHRDSIISPRASMPEARQNNSKLAEMSAGLRASALSPEWPWM